jgi:hypothetical protein
LQQTPRYMARCDHAGQHGPAWSNPTPLSKLICRYVNSSASIKLAYHVRTEVHPTNANVHCCAAISASQVLMCSLLSNYGRMSKALVAFASTSKTAAAVSAGNFLAKSGHSCSMPASRQHRPLDCEYAAFWQAHQHNRSIRYADTTHTAMLSMCCNTHL